MAKVVLVDDQVTMVQMVTEVLRAEGHDVIPFTQSQAATLALSRLAPELIIANAACENSSAGDLTLLQQARTLNPPAVCLMITPPGSIEAAVSALRRGAYDYLAKPFTLDELKLRVQRSLAYQSALAENMFLRRQVQSKFQFKEIIGVSPRMIELVKLLERIADTDSSVLISGPAGAGKKFIARILHFNSRRRFAPFLVLSCSSGNEQNLEEELFGARKGHVIGLPERLPGAFEKANGGTLFLDQVDALPPPLQSRLIRVLQEHHLRRTAESNPVPLDIRLMAGTELPLDRQAPAGQFREDLLRELSVIPLVLPALQERPEDIPLLINHFLEGKTHARSGQPIVLTREALELCSRYEWPGNVRELENTLQRASVASEDGSIRVTDLPEDLQELAAKPKPPPPPAPKPIWELLPIAMPPLGWTDDPADPNLALAQETVPLKQFLRNQELAYMCRMLARAGGKREKAAELLGISMATMYRKLSETGIFDSGSNAPSPEVEQLEEPQVSSLT